MVERIQPLSLPYISAEISGIGGAIKVRPEHFIVEEIPLYEPCGEGEHLYVRLTRTGWTTRDVQKRLADIFELKPSDIGYAGLKDKHARTTQVFSIPGRDLDEDAAARRIPEEAPFEVAWALRHRNKLKAGHLLGNSFRIIVSTPAPDASVLIDEVRSTLLARGLPNFYGEQRFGMQGDNEQKGLEALRGRGPRDRWSRRFLLSALQAGLFNAWLVERIRSELFETVLAGDIAKKVASGGIFEVEAVDEEMERLRKREITYTGPIYGAKMRWATGEPGALERRILDEAGITVDVLRKARLDGSRRAARILLDDIAVDAVEEGLRFSFSLPKGSYATTVMREFMKATE